MQRPSVQVQMQAALQSMATQALCCPKNPILRLAGKSAIGSARAIGDRVPCSSTCIPFIALPLRGKWVENKRGTLHVPINNWILRIVLHYELHNPARIRVANNLHRLSVVSISCGSTDELFGIFYCYLSSASCSVDCTSGRPSTGSTRPPS